MANKFQMKRSIALHPIACLIVSVLLVLSLAALLISLWIKTVERIENVVKLVEGDINQNLVSNIHKAAALFSPINASATNLTRVLSSSLGENNLEFSLIESKVAPTLFQALLTIPYLSQISYIGLDGSFLAYYTERGQPYALYSNSTFQNGTESYTWYVQTVNHDTGKPYGEVTKSPPSAVVNSSWFQAALNTTNGYASVGTGWGNAHDILLLCTANMSGRSAISLGVPMKSIVNVLVAQVALFDGRLYLATKDGTVLTPETQNMHVFFADNQVSFQLLEKDGDQANAAGNVTCHHHSGTSADSILAIGGKKYAVRCSPVEIAGLQLLSVLAMPHKEFSSIIHKNIRLALVLLILMIGAVLLTICAFIYLFVGFARREMHLCGALINQMEATQQAERKSMNKSLAFASASHDIRASLAGIIGLIEICHNEATKRDPSRSEMLTNLSHMDTCTRDLLGILNSILDTSKIEAGMMQLDEEEFDMEQLLEDVVDLYHPVGMKKGVDVILDPYDGSVTKCSRVKGDRGKLKQILSNLLSNAVKFTSEGHVTVRAWSRKQSPENELLASSESNSVKCLFCLKIKSTYSESEAVNIIQRDRTCVEFVFEVSDTGRGIPKERRKSVFENYVQIKETAVGQEGTGLGLGIVQSLVRLMGGEIQIIDKDVGERGTCFRFNAFLGACEADMSSNISTRAADIEANGDYISSNSYQNSGPIARVLSPKAERSQVVLFIQNAERSKVVQVFMQRLGIKVHAVREHEQLFSTLKKINKKQNLSHSQFSSSSNSRSDGLASHASSTRSKEVPLGAWDGMDNVLPSQRKANSDGSSFTFVLLVIDTHAGLFWESSKAVAKFKRDLNENCSSRVVWLCEPNASSGTFHGLNEDKLPPSDLIISKPFHGSRLYQTVGLLPEFGGTIPRRGQKFHRRERVQSRNMSSAERFGTQKGEIEEVRDSNSRKPLTGKRILVVDDDPVGRKIATFVGSQVGADIVSCENGEEAWKLVCRRLNNRVNVGASEDSVLFDVILMDCQMPVMDGIEATGRIREVEGSYGIHTPIIALTAHENGEEINRMFEAGVDCYVTKPLNRDKFLKATSELNLIS